MPKIVDKKEMCGRIMDAALVSFTKQGYHATRMTDVASQAGLAKGTLYLYFSGKDDLTIALIHRYFSEIETAIDATEMPETLAEFLDGLRLALMPSQDRIAAMRLFFDVLGPGFSLPEGRQVIGAFFRRLGRHYEACLEHLVRRGQVSSGLDVPSTGAAIVSMADGMIIHLALFEPSPTLYADRVNAAIALLERGLHAA